MRDGLLNIPHKRHDYVVECDEERIQQELNKMFIHNTIKTLTIINELSNQMLECLFKKVVLISTLKQLK